MSGLLIIISGPSGAGKGTVMRDVLNDPADRERRVMSVSVTTRQKRDGEEDGKEYFFRTEHEFLEMVGTNEFLEFASVVGSYYGTPRSYVEGAMAEGKTVFLEIDIKGAMQVKEKCSAVTIFLAPPGMEELKRRLMGRMTETPEQIDDRMKKAAGEMSFIGRYDYLVVNDRVEDAVARINAIISAERLRTARCAEIIKEITAQI